IADLSESTTCDDDPATRLDAAEEQRRAFLSRKDHISRMSRDATDLAIARELEFQRIMSLVQPDDPTVGDVAVNAGEKALGAATNRFFVYLRSKALVAGTLPEFTGPIGMLISIGQILQSANERLWLEEAEDLVDTTLSALEAAAYLEGLIDRYAALEEAQDDFRDAILDTFRSECVCIK
ncbi:hypothetical protein ACFLQM_02035, partial [Acidobacteriota bacterium]